MKLKIPLIVIFLFSNTCLHSQIFRLGIEANILAGNKYYNYQVGPSVIAEYGFEKIPLTINTGVRLFFISELNKKYLPGYSNNSIGFGVSVNYFPIKWNIQPYFGLGLFYYSNNIKAGGMPAYVDGHMNYIENEDNNFSVELTGGIKFSAYSPINFILEFTQTFSKKADLISLDTTGHIVLEKSKISIFNSLIIRFGVLFCI